MDDGVSWFGTLGSVALYLRNLRVRHVSGGFQAVSQSFVVAALPSVRLTHLI